MPELRKDPLLGRWVVIDSERVRRPIDFHVPHPPRHSRSCPLCAGREREMPPELLAYRDKPDDGGWRVRVVPNKFPALRVEGDLERRGHGLYDLMNGVGAHEVVVESPRHEDTLGRLTIAAVEDVVRAWRDRILDLKRDHRFRSIVVFKSYRIGDGSADVHAHSQLLATPTPSRVMNDELHHARAYHDYRERCLFCDILHQETEERARVVIDGEHVVAFAPFAARVPFETWLLPRRHMAAFEHSNAAELRDLARGLRGVLRRLDRALGDPAFELTLHTAPFADAESPYYHWHVEITPTLPLLVGADRGSGFSVNPLPPEDAARCLRDTTE